MNVFISDCIFESAARIAAVSMPNCPFARFRENGKYSEHDHRRFQQGRAVPGMRFPRAPFNRIHELRRFRHENGFALPEEGPALFVRIVLWIGHRNLSIAPSALP